MREYFIIGILLLFKYLQGCDVDEVCTECPALLNAFRCGGGVNKSFINNKKCTASDGRDGFCCSESDVYVCDYCNNENVSCGECPSLVWAFENGMINKSYINSKKCSKNGDLFCCSDKHNSMLPSYIPSAEDYTCGEIEDRSAVNFENRVIGGLDAQPGKYSFTALIGFFNGAQYNWRCGGSIINRWYILTAAHCYDYDFDISKEFVNVGDYDLRTEQDCPNQKCLEKNQIIHVQGVKIHEGFETIRSFSSNKFQGNIHDIALVKLSTPVEKNKDVKFVCLPLGLKAEFDLLETENYDDAIVGLRAHAIGWGYTSSKVQIQDFSESTSYIYAENIQKVVELPILGNDECENIIKNFIDNISFADGKRICAGGEDGKDTCRGDSGGPLVISKPSKDNSVWIQIGLTSFGYNTCGAEKPAIYTRISKYIDWIRRELK